MAVEDRDEWVVVCEYDEVGEAGEEDMALLDGPSNSQEFQFNDCISGLCI